MEDLLLIPTDPSLLELSRYKKIFLITLSYPKINIKIARSRLETLRSLGVDAFVLDGAVQLDGISILGKGTNSIVVKAFYKGRLVVVKILRLDSHRATLEDEARILEILKDKDIAPEPILYRDWFLIEEYIPGKLLGDFVGKDIYDYSRWELEIFIESLFKKAFYLDKMNIDHGELTRPEKHVIVLDDLDTRIIDFESASLNRIPKNLTSLYQYFFIRSNLSEYLRSLFGIDDVDIVIRTLSRYKKNRDEDSFKDVLKTFKRDLF